MSLAGCKSVSDLFETELDDSAEGMSGQWKVVESSASSDGCDVLEPAEPHGDRVKVEVVTPESADPSAAPSSPDAGPDAPAETRIDVTICDGEDCEPIHGRYSLFDRARDGWQFDAFEANWARHPECVGQRKQASFVLVSQDEARIELESSRGAWMVEGEQDCGDELVQEREQALECVQRRTYVLRRPTDPPS